MPEIIAPWIAKAPGIDDLREAAYERKLARIIFALATGQPRPACTRQQLNNALGRMKAAGIRIP